MDWDDIQVFLAIVRTGSVNTAARALRVDASTAGRRLARLEQSIGVALFERSVSGCVLTTAGEHVLPEAERLEEAALAVVSSVSTELTSVVGTVRLATAETLFTAFLCPHFNTLRTAHPRLCLELVTSPSSANLLKREADIALRSSMTRPGQNKIVTKKLAEISYGLYASADYLSRLGRPSAGAPGHDIIGYDPQFGANLQLAWLERFLGPYRTSLTTNTMLSRAEACASGWGLAPLPCFLAARYTELVRLEAKLPSAMLWLLVHPELRRSARVRAVLDFLTETVHTHRANLEDDVT